MMILWWYDDMIIWYYYILRATPSAAGPLSTCIWWLVWQALENIKKHDFWTPGSSILTFRDVILVSWGTILVILKSHGHPTGHLGDQTWILVDFWWFLGSPWDQLWSHFDDFFVIWTIKLEYSFQSLFFSDFGLDIAPGCDAWMYLKHSKYNGFVRFTVWGKFEI